MARVLTSRAVRTVLSRAGHQGNRVRSGYQMGGYVVSERTLSGLVWVTHRTSDGETDPAACHADMTAQYAEALMRSGYRVEQNTPTTLRVTLEGDMRCA